MCFIFHLQLLKLGAFDDTAKDYFLLFRMFDIKVTIYTT